MKKKPSCKKCGRTRGYGNMGTEHFSVISLKDGLCVDCEADRFVCHTGYHFPAISKLRLCEYHRHQIMGE